MRLVNIGPSMLRSTSESVPPESVQTKFGLRKAKMYLNHFKFENSQIKLEKHFQKKNHKRSTFSKTYRMKQFMLLKIEMCVAR